MSDNRHKYFVTLPSGLRLMSEAYFLEELKPFGVTVKGFRALCRALNVPSMEIGRVRLIDAMSFALAMKAVMRIGEPDFLVPGCTTLKKNRRTANTATSLDIKAFSKNTQTILAELLYARRFYGVRNSSDVRTLARDAASRLVAMGMQGAPSRLQAESDALMLAKMQKDFPELHEEP